MRLACPAFLPRSKSGTSIVTPTSLLACVARQQVIPLQTEMGLRCWQSPAIQSLDSWLKACWEEARYASNDVPTLLSPLQEALMWRRVLLPDLPRLFNVEATIQLMRRTASAVEQYTVPLDAPEWNEYADAQHFQRWYRRFRKLCSRKHFIPSCDLLYLVPRWIRSGLCEPGETSFCGFRRLPRPIQELVGTQREWTVDASASGVYVTERRPTIICEDFSQELEQAARWARASYEQNPHQSIAVFIPELAKHRVETERAFQQVFYPAAARQFGLERPSSSCIFHIAEKAELTEQPIVASALLLLEIPKRRLPVGDAGAILRCPFLSDAASEQSARAKADLALRKFQEVEVSFEQIQRVSAKCATLTAVWNAVELLLRACPPKQELTAWGRFFGNLLQATGWPGEAKLSPIHQDALECWRSALQTLSTLGLVSGKVSYDTAMSHLRRVLASLGLETGGWPSSVQVWDYCAAEEVEFDRAFVAGVGEGTWPSVRAPQLLVPAKLQNEYGLPLASSQLVQEEQQRMAGALFSAAPVVVTSYSGRLSAFAATYVEPTTQSVPVWTGRLARNSFPAVALEELHDEAAPRYEALGETRGGTGIVRSQSLCPFRAFAEYRLYAQGVDHPSLGLNALQRGGFLHKALELAWSRLGTQVRLQSLENQALEELARGVAAEVVAEFENSPFRAETLRVERDRLAALVVNWLGAVESARLQPFTVERLEEERSYELGGLRLRMRIDRIDRLSNGKLVLIDYKSGETSRGDLNGPRPAEPQLWIYAAALGREVEGIFFGQLKPRSPKLVGYSLEQHSPGRAGKDVLRGEWGTFFQEACEAVERIAADFVEGQASVEPVAGACEYCGIAALCRVQETTEGAKELED